MRDSDEEFIRELRSITTQLSKGLNGLEQSFEWGRLNVEILNYGVEIYATFERAMASLGSACRSRLEWLEEERDEWETFLDDHPELTEGGDDA